MNRAVPCVLFVLLAGCMQDRAPELPAKPVGSYQMLPASADNRSVYVLDTRDGRIAICSQTTVPQEVTCGVAHPQR